jgi:hemolysin activation/secretion protein
MSQKHFLLWCAVLIPSVFTHCLIQNTLPTNAQTANLVTANSVTADSVTISQKPDPNQDRFPQGLPTPQPIDNGNNQQPVLSPSSGSPSEQTNPTPPDRQSEANIFINKIEVSGSTLLKPNEIEALTKPVSGRNVSLDELNKVAALITQLYFQRGYITSRAILEAQEIKDGVVKIRVIEGSIERIEVEGAKRLNPEYIRSRIALGSGSPLSKDKLEDQLQLLRNDPLFSKVEASIKPGTSEGQSIITVRVTLSPAFNDTASVDNYSPPSVGAERLGVGASYRNLTAIGDQLSANYYRSTNGGLNQFDFNYKVPVNSMNGTVQLRVAPSRSRITDPKFSAFDIRANSELYEISYRQPIIRNPREELALSLGFAVQNGQTFLFNDIPFPFGIGPDANGNSQTRVLKFGQDYTKRDTQGATALRSQFNFGLGIFDATINPSPIPDGRFFSWQGQAQRVQRLGTDSLLIATADVQLTPDSLLPSQQFVIGGGQSVRGFRQNARSGDNGVRFSLENRIALQRDESGQPSFQLAPFVDLGTVWNNPNNPNKQPNQTFLAGAGLGLIWQPLANLQVRADYGIPLVNLSDKGNNTQDKGFYFSVVYNP